MKRGTILLTTLLVSALSVSMALAMNDSPVERGKAHFNNPTFAGGKKSCNACHPSGRGLEQAGTKTIFHIMGKEQNSLEEAINVCIVNANRGHAIDVNSQEMQDMVSYIKSL